jgi:hypothetical protein
LVAESFPLFASLRLSFFTRDDPNSFVYVYSCIYLHLIIF